MVGGSIPPACFPRMGTTTTRESEHTMRVISRDPYARTELVRERTYWPDPLYCAFCGTIHETPKGDRYLYQYGTAHDGGRTDWHRGAYCSKSCHDAFHGA